MFLGGITPFANNPQTLEGLAGMNGCLQGSSDQKKKKKKKMLRPKEIEKSNLIVEEVVEVLEETFLNPFSDDLD